MRDRTATSVLSIGSFDGVHQGHAALMRRARELADAHPDRPAVRVLVLDPHPMTILAPERAPARLSTWEQRIAWLRDAGADDVIRLESTLELLRQSPSQFVDNLCAQYNPVAIVEGEDFRFGHKRAGDVNALAALGGAHKIDVDVVASVEVALSDQSIVRAASSIIRWLVTNGRVDDAARVLGRPHEIVGHVVPGDRRGRELGFPTANIDTPCLLPADGVYAGRAMLPDGAERAAAIHVGPRATFDAPVRTLEAHVLDWVWPTSGEPEYGWSIRLHIDQFLRDQARFDSIDALVEQINRDVERTRGIVGVRTLQEASS